MNKIDVTLCIVNYNKSQYLSPLFESLCSQTDSDFQVLFVDNNSTDNSIEIVSKYKNKLNLNLLIEKRQGVQFARETALKNIKTSYFCFVDADDLLSNEYVSFFNRMKGKADLICCNYLDFKHEDELTSKRSNEDKIYTFDLEKRIYSFDSLNGVNYTYLWNKLFSKQICDENNIHFDEDVFIGEDCFFIDKYLEYVNTIIQTSEKLYYYRQSNDSLMRKANVNQSTLLLFLSEIKRCEYMNTILDHNSNQYLDWLTHEVWIYRNIYHLYLKLDNATEGNQFIEKYITSLKKRIKENKKISLKKMKLYIKILFKKMYFNSKN